MSDAFPQPEGNGFDWLGKSDEDLVEANNEMLEAARFAAKEQAKTIHRALSTGDGLQFLDWLRSATVDLPLMDVSNSLVRGEVALSPSDWAYVREGQNSVYRAIMAQMDLAVSPEPNEGKTDGESS